MINHLRDRYRCGLHDEDEKILDRAVARYTDLIAAIRYLEGEENYFGENYGFGCVAEAIADFPQTAAFWRTYAKWADNARVGTDEPAAERDMARDLRAALLEDLRLPATASVEG